MAYKSTEVQKRYIAKRIFRLNEIKSRVENDKSISDFFPENYSPTHRPRSPSYCIPTPLSNPNESRTIKEYKKRDEGYKATYDTLKSQRDKSRLLKKISREIEKLEKERISGRYFHSKPHAA